jgi:hypothetical protein
MKNSQLPLRLTLDDNPPFAAIETWQQPMTMKRFISMLSWWTLCLCVPPLAIIAGALVGAVTGAASGAYDGLRQVQRDLRRLWAMLEGS